MEIESVAVARRQARRARRGRRRARRSGEAAAPRRRRGFRARDDADDRGHRDTSTPRGARTTARSPARCSSSPRRCAAIQPGASCARSCRSTSPRKARCRATSARAKAPRRRGSRSPWGQPCDELLRGGTAQTRARRSRCWSRCSAAGAGLIFWIEQEQRAAHQQLAGARSERNAGARAPDAHRRRGKGSQRQARGVPAPEEPAHPRRGAAPGVGRRDDAHPHRAASCSTCATSVERQRTDRVGRRASRPTSTSTRAP